MLDRFSRILPIPQRDFFSSTLVLREDTGVGADGEEMGVLDDKVGFRENGEESKRVDVVVVGVETAEECGCCCCCCCSVVEMVLVLMAIGEEAADGLPLTCCI